MDELSEPPIGDSLVDRESSSEEEGSQDESEEENPGKYQFNGVYLFVTWSKSKIDDKKQFEAALLPRLPANTRYFGGRELHDDGSPHYHVVFRFEHRVHWADARNHFELPDDTRAIRFVKPKPRQPARLFLDRVQAYVEKDGDTFGERIPYDGPASEEKKRKWQAVLDEDSSERAWKLLRELDPRACVVNFPAVARASAETKFVTSVIRRNVVGR
ncbi:MAG: hypothetical protein Q9223_001267 [Gallowayella weberi]